MLCHVGSIFFPVTLSYDLFHFSFFFFLVEIRDIGLSIVKSVDLIKMIDFHVRKGRSGNTAQCLNSWTLKPDRPGSHLSHPLVALRPWTVTLCAPVHLQVMVIRAPAAQGCREG